MLVIKADLAKMLNIHQNQKEPRGLSAQVATTYQVSFQLSFSEHSSNMRSLLLLCSSEEVILLEVLLTNK